MSQTQPALGLYIHWPWCVRKCPYCDFNSYAQSQAKAEELEQAYVRSLCADLEHAALDVVGRNVTSVFIGGGTPSLMSPESLETIFLTLLRAYRLSGDCEVTMEANPGTADASGFERYAALGVNRFSIGVQSFNDTLLKRLGRIHDADTARRAIEAVSRVVDNFNIDVMYALPGQTKEMLLDDIETALAVQSTHLSFYELTIEEGTAFAKKTPQALPDTDLAADLGELVDARLRSAGFEHYEISGYAKPTRRCRHNLNYWRFGDYVGVGAGAHGKVTFDGRIIRTERTARPLDYIADSAVGRFECRRETVAQDDLPFEFMLNALRLTEGVESACWSRTTGLPFSVIEKTVTALRQEDLLCRDSERIAVTDLGRRFLSDVQERFLSAYCG